jgi:hypothetical protein
MTTSEVEAAVTAWNSNVAGRIDARRSSQPVPALRLPSSYQLGDVFSSQDVRLSKKFTFNDRYSFSIFAEGFNIFNIANLGGHSFTVDKANVTSFAFGQPTSRAGQVFGSGGPRAFQLGGRFQF